jgi:hypothetical protein
MFSEVSVSGSLVITPRLEERHAAYLSRFQATRRMNRSINVLAGGKYPDPIRIAAGLPLGLQGGYYVGETNETRYQCPSIVDTNQPPRGQPGLWCGWCPTPDLEGLMVDRGSRNDLWGAWLRYLIKHFLEPWGYSLNGAVGWQVEERNRSRCAPSCRVLTVRKNRVWGKAVGVGNMEFILSLYKSPVVSEPLSA